VKILAAEIDFADGMAYVATSTFATAAGDTPANQLFRGRLKDVAFERAVSFAVWRGGRQLAPVVQELVLLNADGALDGWLDRGLRDRTVILKVGVEGTAYSTWTVRARLTADKIVQANLTTLVIRFRSKLQRLEKQATASWPVSTPNTELRGTRSPIAIGKLKYAGGVLWQHLSNFERFHAVSDWPIHSISQWWSRYTFGVTPGYHVQGYPQEIYGLRRRTTTSNLGPDDRMCLEMRGAGRLGTDVLAAIGDFKSWTGGDPDGWSVTRGAGLVYEDPTDCVRLDGEDVWIAWTGLTLGQAYQIEVLTRSVEDGVWQIQNGATVLHYQPFDANFQFSPRVWRVSFVASNATVSIGVPTSATGDVSIDHVRIWPITPVDRVKDWFEHICIDRGGMVSDDVDSTSLTALEAAKPYDMAFAAEQGVDLHDLLWRVLDSLNAGVFEGVNGKLKVTRLVDPAGELAIGDIIDDDLAVGWQGEDDDMDGLSTTLTYGVNYAALSESELQSLQAALTIPAATVEALKRRDRKAFSTTSPHSHYARAADADPSPSLLLETADAVAEVSGRCALASTRRRFWSATLKDKVKFASIEPGQIWNVTSARWGSFKVFVALVRGTLRGSEPVLQIRVWR
jgi:hypothetical protein